MGLCIHTKKIHGEGSTRDGNKAVGGNLCYLSLSVPFIKFITGI